MTQRRCDECDSKVADTAKQCHRCGMRLMSQKRQETAWTYSFKMNYLT